MKKRIYLSLLAMGLACIAVTVIIYSWMFWRSTQTQAETELSVAVTMMATGMKQDGDPINYLQQVVKDENGQMRITWIAADGTIKFESDADKGSMENHLERPEVQQAFSRGEGKAVRQSATISRELYYATKKLPDGTILRASIERDSIYSQLFSLLPMTVILLLLACLCCIKASRMLTASLLAPLRKTARVMEGIGTPEQDLPKEMPHVYSELRPLVQKILDQSNYINATIQTLERERNTVRLVMEHLEEGVILTDVYRKIVVINSRAKNILQLRKNTTVTGLSLDQLLVEADWQGKEKDPLPRVRVQKLAKNDRLYRMSAQPIYKDEVLYGALFILYDVTEVERREQLRREFTSNVSHELKTPLTSISGFAEMISAGMYEKEEETKHFGELIQKESQRLLTLIDTIIHLTRIEETPKAAICESVDMKTTIGNIVDFMEPVTQEKGVTIHRDLDALYVRGNAQLLREMCMNVIDNAVKYNRPGGHVYLTLKEQEEDVVFTIKDTGVGIPEEKQQRVFERFYRADDSRSKKSGGSGLGLSIVKHIVEQHHGQITLNSKENEGTTITITLPK